jgi:hypothetical protein
VNPDGWSTGVPTNGGVYSNIEHGNPLLKPEDSRTWTLGVVWQAQERNVTISADWYDILIEEAVGNLNFQNAYRQCFNYTGVENPTFSTGPISASYVGYMDISLEGNGMIQAHDIHIRDDFANKYFADVI